MIFCTGCLAAAVLLLAVTVVEVALLLLLLQLVEAVELVQAEAFEGGDFRFLILELGALFTNDEDGDTSSSLGNREVSSKVNWLSSLPLWPLQLPFSPAEPGFVRGGAGE